MDGFATYGDTVFNVEERKSISYSRGVYYSDTFELNISQYNTLQNIQFDLVFFQFSKSLLLL